MHVLDCKSEDLFPPSEPFVLSATWGDKTVTCSKCKSADEYGPPGPGLLVQHVACDSMRGHTDTLTQTFLLHAIGAACILPSNYKGQNSVSSEKSLLLDHNLI